MGRELPELRVGHRKPMISNRVAGLQPPEALRLGDIEHAQDMCGTRSVEDIPHPAAQLHGPSICGLRPAPFSRTSPSDRHCHHDIRRRREILLRSSRNSSTSIQASFLIVHVDGLDLLQGLFLDNRPDDPLRERR